MLTPEQCEHVEICASRDKTGELGLSSAAVNRDLKSNPLQPQSDLLLKLLKKHIPGLPKGATKVASSSLPHYVHYANPQCHNHLVFKSHD